MNRSDSKGDSAFEAMDRMYRLQRHFYDLTRKYYLLGRDQLLDEMNIRAGESVLEVGCGTGRNLIILAKRCPTADLYGLDASAAMLETARAKAVSANANTIVFEQALADEFSFNKTFGRSKPFDKIFFSYSISMMPAWTHSIENAITNLRPGGRLYIVDFYDQHRLPGWLRRSLRWWLSKFHVHYREELIRYLENLNAQEYRVEIAPLYRSYSFIASLKNR